MEILFLSFHGISLLYLPTICPSLPVEKRSPLELELEGIASVTYELLDFVQVRNASVWEKLLSGK